MQHKLRVFLYSLVFFLGTSLLVQHAAYAQATVVIDEIKNSCGTNNNGSFRITVTGGVPPFAAVIVVPSTSYFNSIPLTLGVTEVIGIAPPGGDLGLPPDNNIVVSVSDGDNSNPNFSTNIQILSVPEISGIAATPVNNSDNSCLNPNGSITINSVAGGSGDFDFSWTGPDGFTATTQTITGLRGGDYVVTVTDRNAGCLFTSGIITLTDPAPSPFTISSPDLTPCANKDIAINLSVAEPGVEYILYVDGNPTGTTVTGPTATLIHVGGLPAGAHTIAVLATLGTCTPVFSTNTLDFDMSAGPTSAVLSGDAVICANTSADLSVVITGGTGPYSITLDNGIGTISNYVSGTAIPVSPSSNTTYNLVGNVTDANGCSVAGTGSATITVNALPTAVASGGGEYCIGNPRPTVTFTFTGAPPFNFTYTNGTTTFPINGHLALTFDIPNAAEGSYSVTALSDNNGCVGTALGSPVAVDENPLPTASVTGGGMVCSGDVLPDVTFTLAGTAPFDFTYTDGNTSFNVIGHLNPTFTIDNASPGSYSVTALTDANGCAATDLGVSADVIVNPLPTASINGGGTYCQGGTLPTVSFTFTGAMPFDFSYTVGATLYTVTDHNSLTYEVANASVGTYTITALSDNSGCAATALGSPVVVTENPLPTAATSGGGIICAGSALPNVTFTFTGTAPFDFTYTDGATPVAVTGHGATNYTLPNAPAGTYSITSLTDANGCVATTLGGNAVVTVNPLPTASVSGGGSICVGATRPDLTFTFAGKTPFDFTYSNGTTSVTINNHNSTTFTIPNAAAGIYAITALTDDNGCVATDLGTSVAVVENALPTASTSGGGTVCAGDVMPDVILNFTGAAPFSFTYTNGATPVTVNNHNSNQFTIPNAAAGNYAVTALSDANGCVATSLGSSTIVAENPLPSASVSGGGEVCDGAAFPSVTFTFTGAIPFDFTYSDGTNSFSLTNNSYTFIIPNAAPGTYAITALSDNNGCSGTVFGTPVTVTENPLPTASVTGGGAACADQDLPSVTFNFTGSAPFDFTYSDGSTSVQINGHNSNSYTIDDASAGTYAVTALSDAKGCTATDLGGNAVVSVHPLPVATINGGGAYCEAGVEPSLTFAFTGVAPFTFTCSDGTTPITVNGHPTNTFTIPNAPTGTYSITALSDNNGCVAVDLGAPVSVSENALPTAVLSGGGTLCDGDVLPDVTITFNGTAPFSFSYTDGITVFNVSGHNDPTFTISGAAEGNYSVVSLTDANGCAGTNLGAGVDVVVNERPTATITGGGNYCAGDVAPAVTFTFTGAMPFDFTYTVDATPVTINGHNALTYSIVNPSPGTYAVTDLTDNTTCAATALGMPVSVAEKPLPAAAVSGGGIACSDGTLPDVTFSFTGTAPFDFTYTDGTTPVVVSGYNDHVFTLANASAGSYSVTALSDADGCNAASFGGAVNVIVEPAALVEAGNPQMICTGNMATLTGSSFGGSATTAAWSIISQPAGGDGSLSDLTYSTSPSSVTFTGTVAGDYVLRLTSDEPVGVCEAVTDDVVITISDGATVDAGIPQTACESGTITLAGNFSGALGVIWTTAGNGTFDDPSLPNAVYTPGPADIAAGTVTLTLTTGGPCAPVNDDVVISIINDPVVEAGAPAVICSSDFVVLGASFGGSATGLTWSTDGDGLFNDVTDPDARYTPGPNDVDNGSVILTATATGSCPGFSDVVTITINEAANIDAGDPQLVCIGNPVALNATISGAANSVSWSTSGDGTFDDHTKPDAIYTPGVSDLANGSVTLIAATNNPPGPCPADNDQVVITFTAVPGDETTPGNETWIGYVYDDSGDGTPYPGRVDFHTAKYRGYIDANDIAGMTPASAYDPDSDMFDLNLDVPDDMHGPALCGTYANNFSVRYKMNKTFAEGVYRFTIGSDDGVRLLIDGVEVISGAFVVQTYGTPHTSAPICLSGTHSIEIQYFENAGYSRLTFDYEAVPPLTTNGPLQVCVNSPAPVLTASGADPDIQNFNWYKNGTLVFSGANYTPAASELDMTVEGMTTFTVKGEYGCGESPGVDVTVEVLTSATLVINPQTICESGGIVDLRNFIDEAPPGGSFTFAGLNVTGNSFDPSTLAGTTVSILVDYSTGSCTAPQGVLEITVTNTALISGPTSPVPVCEFSPDIDLKTLVSAIPAGGTFSFSGTQVTGDYFDPTGISGQETILVNYSIGGCVASQIAFEVDVTNSSSVVTSNTITCENGSPINLLSLVSGAPSGGNFAFAGPGVSGSIFNPSGQSGVVNISVDYDFNGCTSHGTIQVTVRPSTDPVCMGGNCISVKIVPKDEPATCTNSDGRLVMSIVPFTPAINNTGVRIAIDGISSTGLHIARTIYNDSVFNALPVGSYDYTIEYGDPSCIKTGKFSIDQSGTVGSAIVSNIISPQCFGTATGSLVLNVPGEAGNVLEWSLDGGQTDPFKPFTAGGQITGIPAGPAPTYQQVISVRRNAADVCYAAAIFTMPESATEMTATFNITPATCNGNDGAITGISAGGGNGGPYAFSIDNGQSFQAAPDFTNLIGGNYTLLIRDSKDCERSFSANILSPGYVDFSHNKTHVDCQRNYGSIAVTFPNPGEFLAALTTDPLTPPADDQYKTRFGNGNVEFPDLPADRYYIFVKSKTSECATRSDAVDILDFDWIDFTIEPHCDVSDLSITLTNVTGLVGGPQMTIYMYRLPDISTVFERIEVPFPSNGEIFLGHNNYDFLKSQGDYLMRVVQVQLRNGVDPCDVTVEKKLTVPGPLAAKAIPILPAHLASSYPDIPSGKLMVGSFAGGVGDYSVRIDLDSASSFAMPSFQTEFAEARLNNNAQFEMLYENIPPGRYVIDVTDTIGCSVQFVGRVPLDESLYIPNIFTPNGDEDNETFYIRNLPTEGGENHLVITNRWGKEVFVSENYQNNWDGRDAADGIYFYRLQLASGDTRTGWVEIIRGPKP